MKLTVAVLDALSVETNPSMAGVMTELLRSTRLEPATVLVRVFSFRVVVTVPGAKERTFSPAPPALTSAPSPAELQ